MRLPRLARAAIIWVATTSLAVGVAAATIAGRADATTAAYVTTANLNVRTSPSTSASIVTTLPRGTTVTATAAVSKGWLPITYAGRNAYVFADYVKASGVPSTTTATTTVNVNFRTKASLTSSVIRVLPKGTQVTTGATSGDFTAVEYQGTGGFVYSVYLTGTPTGIPLVVITRTLYILGSNVRVRALPSTESTVITSLDEGTALQSDGTTQNGFTSVVYKDAKRWVSSQYLTATPPTPGKKPPLDLSRAAMWDRIAQCESSGRWHINTGNGHYGGLQFDLPTWRDVQGQDYATRPDLASREEQITVANRLYAKRGLQPWSCRKYA